MIDIGNRPNAPTFFLLSDSHVYTAGSKEIHIRGRRPKPSRVYLLLSVGALSGVAVVSAWSPDAPWFLSATLCVCYPCGMRAVTCGQHLLHQSLSAYRIQSTYFQQSRIVSVCGVRNLEH